MPLKIRNKLPGLLSLALLLLAIAPVTAKAPVLTDKQIHTPPPRIIRTCCSFGANMGFVGIPFAKKTDITAPSELGPHQYLGSKEENNGNIYTKRGGFLDLGHVRDCADWTAYLYLLISEGMVNDTSQRMELGREGGLKTLQLNVSGQLDEEEMIQLAGKIAYDLSVWHEISTWFGSSYVPLVPERYSSFSPEDLYSNLLGVHIAMNAIKSNLDYNEAMTLELEKMLEELEAVSSVKETFDAMVMVDQEWYNSQKRLPGKRTLLKRYLDSGTELTPWLVNGLESRQAPYVLNKPRQNLTDYYELEIKLNFKFPVKDIFPELDDRMITQHDFEVFIDYIQDDLDLLQEKEENRAKRIERKNSGKISSSEIPARSEANIR